MTDIFEDKPDPQGGDNAAKASAAEITQFLDRIERLEDEKAVLSTDISEEWKAMKSRGYDVKALRKLHSIRKMKPEERTLVRFYGDATGVFS